MPQENTVPNFEAFARQLLSDLVTYTEVTALNFFKDSFDRQGWLDGSFTPWPATIMGPGDRNILINSGNLRDSLRVLKSSPLQIVFGTSEPYAGIHNEGGTITINITDKARKFFWAMYMANVGKGGVIKQNGSATAASMWKAMALTKKSSITIHMPQRQYIGESQTLMKGLNTWLDKKIEEGTKQL